MPTLKKPYSGTSRKLVLAFDVGTTYSGIGYAILDPGEVPKIQGVTRFPGQENGDFKIPTVMWYTQDGKVRAAGAEARASSMTLIAEDEDLVYVEWFKLHMRPQAMKQDTQEEDHVLPPLPRGKTVIEVFADFMVYLVHCARQYIIETHPSGDILWASVQAHIDVVLTHPNGWEGTQQGQMRQAAILAGIVPNTTSGHERVHFVTEGEASLHYCIESGLAEDAIQDGKAVIVVDAGGGTVDLSTYEFIVSNILSVEEIAPPDCILHGSTRINARARKYLVAKLRNSRYGNDEDLLTMMDNFERAVKPTFKDPFERFFIKFGSMRDRDPDVGIRNGQLPLEGADIEGFFEPSIKAIVDAVRNQRLTASRSVSIALLVGGFAASPWLFGRLKSILQDMGVELARPDNHTNKAVAEGAVSFYLGHAVAARVSRLTYGIIYVRQYNPAEQEHFARRAKLTTRASGGAFVPDAFVALLIKGKRVTDREELSHAFFQDASQASILNKISVNITCYRGASKDPQWCDTEPEHFTTLCTVHADTSRVVKRKQRGPRGVFYQQNFKVVLSCGLTELKAQISWIENGVEKRGPATIVYDNDAAAC